MMVMMMMMTAMTMTMMMMMNNNELQENRKSQTNLENVRLFMSETFFCEPGVLIVLCKIIITSIGQNLSFFMYLFHARFLKWFKCTVTSLIYTDMDQWKGCGWWKMWKQTNLKAMPLLRYKWCDFQLPEWIVSIFQTRHENQTAPVK